MNKKMIQELLDSAKSLIDTANKMIDGDEKGQSSERVDVESTVAAKSPSVGENEFQVRTIESKTPVWGGNKFEDMVDLDTEKPEGYEALNDDIKPTKRSRRAYTPIDVECASCHKHFAINPLFKKDFFTCDKCVGKRVGRDM